MRTFRYDADHDTLWALACTDHLSERVVVVKEDIFRVIEQEHLLEKHASQNMTWKAIKNTYYGISRDEVIFVVKQCEICHKKAANQSRGPLTPIISIELFERVQIDLINFRHQPDASYGPAGPKYYWVMHIKDHFSKFT